MIKLRIWRWEDYLALSELGGNVVIRVLVRGKQGLGEAGVSLKLLCFWSEDGRKGTSPGKQVASRSGEKEEMDSPPEPSEPAAALSTSGTLILGQGPLYWTSGSQNCKTINPWCFKPLSLW